MTALYVIAALSLLVVAVVGCAWAGWAIADGARRPDVQGVVTFRLLLVVLTVMALGAEQLVDVSLVVAAVLVFVAQRWVLAPLGWKRPLPRRTAR